VEVELSQRAVPAVTTISDLHVDTLDHLHSQRLEVSSKAVLDMVASFLVAVVLVVAVAAMMNIVMAVVAAAAEVIMAVVVVVVEAPITSQAAVVARVIWAEFRMDLQQVVAVRPQVTI
jgi:hypothetical protein